MVCLRYVYLYVIKEDPLLHASVLPLDSFYFLFCFDGMNIAVNILPIYIYIYIYTGYRRSYYRGSVLINTGRFVPF